MKSFLTWPAIIWRVVATVLFGYIFGMLRTLYEAGAQLKLGELAAQQLANSDAAFYQFTLAEKFFRSSGVIQTLVFVAVLALIWWKPIKQGFDAWNKLSHIVALALACTVVMSYSPDAMAYYDQKDFAEWSEIGANQSAFLIPMTGANKDSQTKFGSIDYLSANKIGAKRVQIPHAKADNTGTFKDYYVSTARLFIVDRTPFTREWQDSSEKGTSAKKEGFRFESADSLTISTAITISAVVTEEDAAKFFYWFGTTTQAPSAAPADVFASVKYGRSLAEVMDTTVRSRVQVALAKEFGKYQLIDGITKKAAIIDEVERLVKADFASKGITILFLGYADELTLDPKIQSVMTEVYVMRAKYAAKDAYATVLELETKQANNEVIKATGTTMQKWNGVITLPTFFMGSDKITDTILGWFGKTAPQQTKGK